METRIHILDAAERVARARGFDGFSYADLSEEVGIRKASIHHHFPAKADLALAMVRRYRENFFEALALIDARRLTGLSKINAYVKLYRQALDDGKRVCLCVSLSAGPDSLTRSVLDELNQFHDDSIAWLTATLKEGVKDGSLNSAIKPSKDAVGVLAGLEGAHLLARAARDVTKFDQAVRSLVNRLHY